MGEHRTYRASEAPLAMLCPAAVNAPTDEILIDSVNPAGTVGTGGHLCWKWMVDYNAWPTPAIEGLPLEPAQVDEIRMLTAAAWDFWKTNGPAFGGGVDTEVELKNGVTSGHLDVLSMPFNDSDPPNLAHVLDWKSTRLDIDYTNQMLFYAWLVVANFPKITRVKTVVVFLRDRTANIREWTTDHIWEFAKRYEDQVINWDGRTYRPGGHCGYCKRFARCPARANMVSAMGKDLMGDIPPHDLADFYGRLQVVETLTQKAREQVRATVEQAGGELPGLKLVPSSRDTIDAKKAWPVLLGFFEDPDNFADAVEIKKGPLMEAAASIAPRGGKKGAKERLMTYLKGAGAVTTTEFKTLRVVQNKESEVLIAGTSETE